MPVITLKAGREKSLIRLHPWIFSGAIDRIEGDPDAGAVVDVHTGDGVLIGRGGYSPASQITVRMWSFTPEDTIDREFLHKRISTAIGFRSALPSLPDAERFRLYDSGLGEVAAAELEVQQPHFHQIHCLPKQQQQQQSQQQQQWFLMRYHL